MERIIFTLELTDETITSRRPELAKNSFELIEAFIDWQLTARKLNYCLLSLKTQSFSGLIRDNQNYPAICSVRDIIHSRRKELAKISNKGYAGIHSSHSKIDEIADFFENFHFQIMNTKKGSLENSSIFEGAPNRDNLKILMQESQSLGGKSFCCFAHDADPIYLFQF